MESWKELFKEIKPIEPPPGLYHAIIQGVSKEKTKHEQKIFFGHATLLFISGIIFIPATRLFFRDLSQSGMFNYLSLLFTDPGIIAAYWQDFLLSLAESLPASDAALFLGTIFMFLATIRQLTKQKNLIFSRIKFT